MPRSGKKSPAAAEMPAESTAKVTFATIDEHSAGQRLDNFLLTRLKGVPKSHVYRIVRAGEVRVNKGRCDVAYRLALADVVRIPPLRMAPVADGTTAAGREAAVAAQQFGRQLRFLYEDDALLAIDKPAGMAVHGGSGVSAGAIEALRALRPDAKFLELVHRIDRETSGVLLVAKKRSALTALHALLRGDGDERVEKHYVALVRGAWPDTRRHIRSRLTKFVNAAGERRVAVDEDEGQESHTIVTRLEQLPGATLLDCEIRTGRTHQIRVHLASLDYPIVGDDKYGDFALNKYVAAAKHGGLKRMFLHARRLKFAHPLSGDALSIEAPLHADLSRYLDYLRGGGDQRGAAA
jgi:23S rRNA pseudouridine955/2504/2580 synthase